MTENVSFTEQEHHILINNNLQEDGTLINDKNKVDFAIGNNHLNNNINKVGTSKPVFRMNSTYGPRPCYKSSKVLPLSQSQPDQQRRSLLMTHLKKSVCNKCKRTFKTHRGLQQHQRSCKENQITQSNLTILSLQSISLTRDTCENNERE